MNLARSRVVSHTGLGDLLHVQQNDNSLNISELYCSSVYDTFDKSTVERSSSCGHDYVP